MVRYLLFSLALFFVGSCVGLQAAVFKDSQQIYTIEFPNDWTVEEKDKNGLAWVVGSSSDAAGNIQITYNEKTSKTSLNEYLPALLTYMKEKYAEVRIEEIGSTEIGGQEAKSIRFSANGPSGKAARLQAIHYLLVLDQHLMIILCVAPESQFAKWEPTFKKTLETLQFK